MFLFSFRPVTNVQQQVRRESRLGIVYGRTSGSVSVRTDPSDVRICRSLLACSLHDLEEIFWGMLSPGEMARNHLKTVVKSIDPGETGKVGLRELVTFIHTRQGGGKGNAGKAAETGLRRCV